MKEIRGDKIIWYAYDGLGRITAKRTSIEKKTVRYTIPGQNMNILLQEI